MPSLTIVNYLVERNNRWRNLWKTFEFFEFLGILGWIVNIDNLDSRIAIYKRRGLTKVVELKPIANYLYIRGSVSGYIIALLGILGPRSFHDHEYPKSSLTVFHGLASFENYDGHENSRSRSYQVFDASTRSKMNRGASRISNHSIDGIYSFLRWNGGYVVNVDTEYRNFDIRQKIELFSRIFRRPI